MPFTHMDKIIEFFLGPNSYIVLLLALLTRKVFFKERNHYEHALNKTQL